jgi:hypothetical protein
MTTHMKSAFTCTRRVLNRALTVRGSECWVLRLQRYVDEPQKARRTPSKPKNSGIRAWDTLKTACLPLFARSFAAHACRQPIASAAISSCFSFVSFVPLWFDLALSY